MRADFDKLLDQGKTASEALTVLCESKGLTAGQVIEELVQEGVDHRRFNRIVRGGMKRREEPEDAPEEAGVEQPILTVGWLLKSMGLSEQEREENLTVRVRARELEGEIVLRGRSSWIARLVSELPVESWAPGWKNPGELWIVAVTPEEGEADDGERML